MFNKQFVMIKNNAQLYTESFGIQSDPAIVLISGTMATARFWIDDFCQQLAEMGYFVIRYDHRDTGLSTEIDYAKNSYTLNDMAKDVIAILDAYKIHKAHIVGHSMGGLIAKICAIDYPNRCSSMTLIASSQFLPPLAQTDLLTEKEKDTLAKTYKIWKVTLENNSTNTYEETMDHFLGAHKYLNGTLPFDEQLSKDLIKDMFGRSGHVQQPKKHNQTKEMHNHVKARQSAKDRTQEVKNLRLPLFVIHGQNDVLCLPRLAIEEANQIPTATIKIIPEMGHMMFNRTLLTEIGYYIIEFIEDAHIPEKQIMVPEVQVSGATEKL